MRDYTTIQELVNLAREKGGFFEAVLDNYAGNASNALRRLRGIRTANLLRRL